MTVLGAFIVNEIVWLPLVTSPVQPVKVFVPDVAGAVSVTLVPDATFAV